MPNHVHKPWTPSSWKKFPISQQPKYGDEAALGRVLERIKQFPPLVQKNEIFQLKQQLNWVSQRNAFMLQVCEKRDVLIFTFIKVGDCAESFEDCTKSVITNKLKVILQMSLIILQKTNVPILKILRIAGQYAKPRSTLIEKVDGDKVVPAFRGVNVNSVDIWDREANSERLITAYLHSAATLNYVRSIGICGFEHTQDAKSWSSYLSTILRTQADRAADIRAVIDKVASDKSLVTNLNFFTSHEALLLNNEEAFTECIDGEYYNTGAHSIWIGDRTRQIDGAHVEYCRGIENSIGIKIGPSADSSELSELLHILNPNKQPDKIMLVTRYGQDKISNCLPAHIKAAKDSGIPVIWCCDPCHGNTEFSEINRKTRFLDKAMNEIGLAFRIHHEYGSCLNGLHVELTGDNVTECLGGSAKIEHQDLAESYKTLCDPRFNYIQSLDMSFYVAEQISRYFNK